MSDAAIDRRESSRVRLAVVDAGAPLAFVMLGLRSHEASSTVAAAARTALPLLLSWFAVAAIVGTYRAPRARDSATRTRALLLTWAVSVPIAISVRTLVLGHPTGLELLTFLAVTLVVTLVLLVIGRLVVAFVGGAARSAAART